jgi:hypothetical protein
MRNRFTIARKAEELARVDAAAVVHQTVTDVVEGALARGVSRRVAVGMALLALGGFGLRTRPIEIAAIAETAAIVRK